MLEENKSFVATCMNNLGFGDRIVTKQLNICFLLSQISKCFHRNFSANVNIYTFSPVFRLSVSLSIKRLYKLLNGWVEEPTNVR